MVQDGSEQLVLVFVTLNESIIDVLFVVQPEGGFYPLVLMQPWAKHVRVEMLDTVSAEDTARLTKYFRNKFAGAFDTFRRDSNESCNYNFIEPNFDCFHKFAQCFFKSTQEQKKKGILGSWVAISWDE